MQSMVPPQKLYIDIDPLCLCMQDGKVVDKVEGFVPAPKLQDRVNFRLDRPLGPGRSYNGP